MDSSDWNRLQELFYECVALPEPEWRGHLLKRAGDDPALVDEVLEMLAVDKADGTFLDRDMPEVAGDLLGSEGAEPPPREFGPYRILRLLGEGGMGVVYLAERVDLKSRVALKILRDSWLSPSRRERFAGEQRTLAGLNHPAIARLYDAGSLPNGAPWFAMEYVEGVPLTQYCIGKSIPERIRLFREVCLAVQHAHQRAIIHRDLKPSNILATRDGVVKLLDFGIAKSLDSMDTSTDQTRTNMRLMTPAYAAPEQLSGGQLGVWTDIYALGVIFHELLTGQSPADPTRRSPAELEILLGKQAEAPSIVAQRAETGTGGTGRSRDYSRSRWTDLDVLCLTALQKNPARRYPSVEALVRDIDHFLAGEPLEARADTMGYRLNRFVGRNWRPLSIAGLVFLFVVGLVTFYTLRLVAARDAAVASSVRAERIQDFMTKLFQGDDEEAGPADSLRVVTLLDRGTKGAAALRNEPAVQAELFQTLGGIYQALGEFDRADSLLQAALNLRLAQTDRGDLARSYSALAFLRSDQSRLDEADSLARLGLDTARSLNPRNPTREAQAAAVVGEVLEARGDYGQAIDVLQKGLRLIPAGDADIPRLSILTDLANCFYYIGRYSEADSLNRALLAIDRRIHGDDHPDVAADLTNLGSIAQDAGRPAEAENYFREALAIYESWFGMDHYETASTLSQLGAQLEEQGKLSEASDCLHQALTIREHIYGPRNPKVALTLNALGLLAEDRGEYDEADSLLNRAISISREAYNDRHSSIGTYYGNLAGVSMDRKDYRQAELQYREAIRRYRDTLPADHLYLGGALVRLGRALLFQGRHRESELESRKGYEILTKQDDPPVAWLKIARKDLVAEYEALKDTLQAARFRKELEAEGERVGSGP